MKKLKENGKSVFANYGDGNGRVWNVCFLPPPVFEGRVFLIFSSLIEMDVIPYSEFFGTNSKDPEPEFLFYSYVRDLISFHLRTWVSNGFL